MRGKKRKGLGRDNSERWLLTYADMLIYTRYYMKLKRAKISDCEMLGILDIEFEKRRKALLKASVERKRFDRLKEIQQSKHLEELNKKTARQADESGRISH